MFENWRERKNEEIKRRISSSSLIPVYTIHPPLSMCVLSFNLLGLTVPEKSVTKHFDLEGYGMTEAQKHRMTEGQGKSSIAPTFSKRDYNKHKMVLRN